MQFEPKIFKFLHNVCLFSFVLEQKLFFILLLREMRDTNLKLLWNILVVRSKKKKKKNCITVRTQMPEEREGPSGCHTHGIHT